MTKLNYEEQIKKIGVIKSVLVFACIVCIAFICLLMTELKTAVDKEKAVTEIPTGGLSNSVFDLQNSEYDGLAGEMYTADFIFNGHYAYDMYEGTQSAKAGKTTFYHIKDNVVVGVSAIEMSGKDDKKALEVLNNDMKEAFGTSPLKLSLKEEGYRNGFSVTYYYLETTMNNQKNRGVVYVATCDEGAILVSAFGDGVLKDAANSCLKIYTTIHVTAEWIANNEEETNPSFSNEEETTVISY